MASTKDRLCNAVFGCEAQGSAVNQHDTNNQHDTTPRSYIGPRQPTTTETKIVNPSKHLLPHIPSAAQDCNEKESVRVAQRQCDTEDTVPGQHEQAQRKARRGTKIDLIK